VLTLKHDSLSRSSFMPGSSWRSARPRSWISSITGSRNCWELKSRQSTVNSRQDDERPDQESKSRDQGGFRTSKASEA